MLVENELFYYTAFGLTIESGFELSQLTPILSMENTDVRIIRNDSLDDVIPMNMESLADQEIMLGIEGVGHFRITNGQLIEIQPVTTSKEHLAVFVLGSAMGAVLHQRGALPLHGSCVSNGTDSVLISGKSGAGKSTLASVFLSKGWKILTDDVAVVQDHEGTAFIQPSYPSQKLWSDSPEMQSKGADNIHTLYNRDGREKYGVFVKDQFQMNSGKLSLFVILAPTETETKAIRIDGIAEIDQLMRNTYRHYMIQRKDLDRHFQRCVTLACNIPMIIVFRNENEESREKLYQIICDKLAEFRKVEE